MLLFKPTSRLREWSVECDRCTQLSGSLSSMCLGFPLTLPDVALCLYIRSPAYAKLDTRKLFHKEQ
jgi:hypothetical protein